MSDIDIPRGIIGDIVEQCTLEMFVIFAIILSFLSYNCDNLWNSKQFEYLKDILLLSNNSLIHCKNVLACKMLIFPFDSSLALHTSL